MFGVWVKNRKHVLVHDTEVSAFCLFLVYFTRDCLKLTQGGLNCLSPFKRSLDNTHTHKKPTPRNMACIPPAKEIHRVVVLSRSWNPSEGTQWTYSISMYPVGKRTKSLSHTPLQLDNFSSYLDSSSPFSSGCLLAVLIIGWTSLVGFTSGSSPPFSEYTAILQGRP